MFNDQMLPEGNCDGVDLAAAVTSQMGDVFAVTYDEGNLALNVSRATLEFRSVLPSDKTGYPTLKDPSCNAVNGHTVPMAYAQPCTTDNIPQLHGLKTVFLHSGLGEAQSLSPHGAQDVKRKITMTVPYGGIETGGSAYAWVLADIGGRELLRLRFTF